MPLLQFELPSGGFASADVPHDATDEELQQIGNHIAQQSQQQAAPPPQSTAAGAFGRGVASHAGEGIGGGLGAWGGAEAGAGIGALAGPGGALVGGIIGGIGGAIGGGYLGHKAQGAPTPEQQAQLEIDAQQHGTAASMGGMLAQAPVMLATPEVGLGEGLAGRLAQNAAAGTIFSGTGVGAGIANGTAQPGDIPGELVKGAATMAPLGAWAPVGKIAALLGKPVADAATLAVTGSAYDAMTGKAPFDTSTLAGTALENVPGFLALHLITSLMHGHGAPPLADVKDSVTPEKPAEGGDDQTPPKEPISPVEPPPNQEPGVATEAPAPEAPPVNSAKGVTEVPGIDEAEPPPQTVNPGPGSEPPLNSTPINNATVDATRAANGEEPMAPRQGLTDAQMEAQAGEALGKNPAYAEHLLEHMAKTPDYAPAPFQTKILERHHFDALEATKQTSNAVNDAWEALQKAKASKDPAAIAQATAAHAMAESAHELTSAKLNVAQEHYTRAGTQNSSALRARAGKAGFLDKNGLVPVAMTEQMLRAKRGGAPLKPEELATLHKIHNDEIAKVEFLKANREQHADETHKAAHIATAKEAMAEKPAPLQPAEKKNSRLAEAATRRAAALAEMRSRAEADKARQAREAMAQSPEDAKVGTKFDPTAPKQGGPQPIGAHPAGRGAKDVLDYLHEEPLEKRQPTQDHNALNSVLTDHYRRGVYRTDENGKSPDIAAHDAYNAGFTKAPTVDGLKDAIEAAQKARSEFRKGSAGDNRAERHQIDQRTAFDQDKTKGGTEVSARDLSPGDKIKIGDTWAEVTHVGEDADGHPIATINGGDKYGLQTITHDDLIHASGAITKDTPENPVFASKDRLADQKVNNAELTRLGLPTDGIHAKPRLVAAALGKLAIDTRLPATVRKMASILAKMDMTGIRLQIIANGNLDYAGMYQPLPKGTGQLTLNTRWTAHGVADPRLSIADTLIHESLHHVTSRLIDGTTKRTTAQEQAVKNLQKLLPEIRRALEASPHGKTFDYQTSSLHELISALFTQKEFQDALSGLKAPAPEGIVARARSLLTEIFRHLAKLVTGNHIEPDSLLYHAFDNALSLVKGGPEGGESGASFRSPRSAITPEQDRAYLDAVARGDHATAQKMVDVAMGGTSIHAFRAGDADESGIKPFSSWSQERKTAERYQDNPGFGGSVLREHSAIPDGPVLHFDAANPRGMADLAESLGFDREKGQEWKDNGWRYPWEESSKVKSALADSKYGALKYTDDFPEGAQTTVFTREPKLAEPVTRDASGRVIPLSERFNPQSDSILRSPAKGAKDPDEPLRDIGAFHFENGAKDFSSWAKAMKGDVPGITDAKLKELFPQAAPRAKAIGDIGEQKAKAAKAPRTVEKVINDHAVEGKPADGSISGKFVKDIYKAHYAENLDKPLSSAEMEKRATNDVRRSYPDATDRQIRDAFSDYHKVMFPSKNALAAQISLGKTVFKLASRLEDIINGIAPKRFGLQRRPPNEEAKALQKEINEAMVKMGMQGVKVEGNKNIKDDLAKLKDRMKRSTAENERRVRDGDFSKRTPKQIQLDSEAHGLAYKLKQSQIAKERAIKKIEVANHTTGQKIKDTLVGYRRAALLSGYHVLGKLSAAAMARHIVTPIDEAAGGIIGKLSPSLRTVADKASRQGGFSFTAEGKAITDGIMASIRAIPDIWKTGLTPSDAHSGKTDMHDLEHYAGKSIMEKFGYLHVILKSSAKEAEFARSVQKQVEHALAHGIDPTQDPVAMEKIMNRSYIEAKRAIFQQQNFASEGLSRLKGALEQSKMPGAKGAAFALKILLPITHVPINFAFEAVNRTPVGILRGAFELRSAIKSGLEHLSADDADKIMRHLKQGSVGTGLMMLGYMLPAIAGGYYNPDDKKGPGATGLKPGDIGFRGSHLFMHNSAAEVITMGATMRKVADHLMKGQPEGVVRGAFAAFSGLAGETPYMHTAKDLGDTIYGKDGDRTKAAGNFAGGLAVPQLSADLAKDTDPMEGRKMKTVPDYLKARIPGLREQLPVKFPK